MIAFSTEFLQIEKIQGQPKQYLDNIAYKVGQLLVKFDLLLIFLDLLTSGFVLKWEPVCLILHHHQHKFHPISRIITMSPINVLPFKQSRQQHTCWIITENQSHFSLQTISHGMTDDWLHATQILVLENSTLQFPNHFLMTWQMTDYMQHKFL